MILKTDVTFDLQRVRDIVRMVIDRVALDRPWTQIGLVGNRYDFDSFDPGVIGSMWENGQRRFEQVDFEWFDHRFKDTILHEMWESTYENFSLVPCRMRIMSLHPNRCLSWHNDEEVRLHYVVDTNPGSFLIVSDKGRENGYPTFPALTLDMDATVNHMAADGHVYQLDANHVHTVLNGGKSNRIHLVIDTLSDLNSNGHTRS